MDGLDGESRMGRGGERGDGKRGGRASGGLGWGFVRQVLSLSEWVWRLMGSAEMGRWGRGWRCASAAARETSAVMLEMRGSVLMRISLLRERESGWVGGGGRGRGAGAGAGGCGCGCAGGCAGADGGTGGCAA